MNFPFFTLMGVKTSPIVYDMNSDGEQEVYFGSDNYNFYGLGSNALLLSGFPFTAGNQVRSSPCLLYTSPSPRDKRQARMPSCG